MAKQIGVPAFKEKVNKKGGNEPSYNCPQEGEKDRRQLLLQPTMHQELSTHSVSDSS